MQNAIDFIPFILNGALVTVQLALASVALAIVLGMMGATAKLSNSLMLRSIAQVYTTVIRGIPELVLMLLIFYGGQIAVNEIGHSLGLPYIEIDPFTAGTLTIGFIFGAYMTESFRGGIMAVPHGEIEAGRAFGMSSALVFRRITLPQMIRHALPSFGNNWLVLVKSTALVSVIGLQDVVFRAGQAGGSTRQPFTFYLMAALVYLLITAASQVALSKAERRFNVGVRTE